MRQSAENPRVALFVSITFLFWFTFYTYIPTMTPYLNALGISSSMIGLISGAYGFSQMILRVPLGLASDRLGKRKIFINAGLAIGAISSIGMFFTQNPVLILMLRFLAGVAASVWVVFTILFSSYFDKDKLASRISYLYMANNCGLMISKLAGSAIANSFGHKYSFLLGGAAGLIAAALSVFIVERIPEQVETPSVRQLLGVVKNRNLMAMSTLAVFTQMLLVATANTFTPDAASRLGADSMQLGVLATLASVPAIISSFMCGKLFAGRVNVRMIVAISFALEIIGTLMIPFAPNVTVIYIATFITGFGCGTCMTTLLSYCTLTVDDNRRSAAMGFYQAIYSLGMFAGPVFIGMFVDLLGLNGGFYVASLIALIGLLLTFVLLPRPQAISTYKTKRK